MEQRYSVKQVLSDRQAQSFVSKLVYSIEGITDCRLDEERQELVLQVGDAGDWPLIVSIIDRMVAKESKLRHLAREVIRSTDAASASVAPVRSRERLEEVFPADGTVRRTEAVRLMEALEKRILQFAETHQAKLRQYPAMIKSAALAKCGYVNSFPQNVFYVAEFPHQLPVLEQVRTTEDHESLTRLSPYILSPAVCFHCYEELSGQVLAVPVILTAQGQCFRHEASWRVGEHRLYDFSMREIVYLGDEKFVAGLRQTLMEEVWQWFLRLGLQGRIETAFDPFYFPEDSAKETFQLMADMKYELVVTIDGGEKEFSVASFNLVHDSLCKAFGITDEQQQPWHSGCVAFGIDRFVYALLSVYGAELDQWPAHVRAEVGLVASSEGVAYGTTR